VETNKSDGRFVKGQKKPNQGKRGPDKVTKEIKEMIRQALDEAGGIEYLSGVATSHPAAFCALISKIIPADVKATLKVSGGLVLVPAKNV
jgi:hypothetical protein